MLETKYVTRIKLLIAALKSDKYTQNYNCLSRGSCFCVTGLACEIYRLHTKKGSWVHHDDGIRAFVTKDESSSRFMPVEVKNWFGFQKVEACLSRELVEQNDDSRHNFKTIAKYLERKLNNAKRRKS